MRNSFDVAVEGIGDAAHMPPDAEGSCVEIDGQGIAHLRDTRAIQVEALVVRAGVLLIGVTDVAPVPEGAANVGTPPKLERDTQAL
jgi:hypothetical protein